MTSVPKDEKSATKTATNDVNTSTQDDEVSPPSLRDESAEFTFTREEEGRLVRKIDMRLMPCVWLMYLMSYLDRSNIGNAYTAGMGADLSMTSQDYSVVLLVFFITYCTFEVPSNMLLTRARPSRYLPIIMFLWGGLSMCFAAARSWQVVAVLRVILGALESAFSPGVLFLLSAWYRPTELARRFGIYYTASAVSGIFGGLIAGGILQGLDGRGTLSGWQMLFIVEGAATCAVSILAYFLLPDFPSTTRWLSPRERQIATRRLAMDSLGGTQTGNKEDEPSHWVAFKMALTDWRTWAFTVTYMCTVGSQTIQYFIPELVKSLGYTGFEVQYYSAPIYTCGFVAILIFCFSSDYFKERSYHLAVACLFSVVPFAVIVGVLDNTARYGLLCISAIGLYASCPLVNIWSSNAIPHPSEKRAVAVAFINGMGNVASIYGSFLFPTNSTNYHRTGFGVLLAFMFLAFCLALLIGYLLKRFPYPAIQSDAAETTQRCDEEEQPSMGPAATDEGKLTATKD